MDIHEHANVFRGMIPTIYSLWGFLFNSHGHIFSMHLYYIQSLNEVFKLPVSQSILLFIQGLMLFKMNHLEEGLICSKT